MQAGERVEVRGGQQIGARGEQLAQLHEGGAKLLEIGGELLGIPVILNLTEHLSFERLVKSRTVDEVAAAILQQEPGDVFVLTKPLGVQSQCHAPGNGRGVPRAHGKLFAVPAVVIAASNLMPALRERLADEGELVTFSDTEPIQALQAILEHQPQLIVLERLFAATPRGAALINRIKTDPQLSHSEVRVMSHTGDYLRQVVRPHVAAGSGGGDARGSGSSDSSVATEEPARRLDWHGTRRAQRVRVKPGIEIQLDGNPAAVVDLSTVGAQVLSTTILRPNQKVRVSLPNDDAVMRFKGTVAWAKFELPKPTDAPVYRAGVEFLEADGEALDEFAKKNKK